jgi:hypothetical protein
MRRVLLNACLLMTAVSLSACHHAEPKPEPVPVQPAPVQPAPVQPAPEPVPAYVPPPQPATPPPAGFHTAGQPNGTQQPANTSPSGFHSPNGTATAPAAPTMSPQQQDAANATAEAVAYAAAHGLPNAVVGKVKMGTNNLWNVMLHAGTGAAEKRMHVFVVPNHGGVKTAAVLAGPSAAGWNDEQMP